MAESLKGRLPLFPIRPWEAFAKKTWLIQVGAIDQRYASTQQCNGLWPTWIRELFLRKDVEGCFSVETLRLTAPGPETMRRMSLSDLQIEYEWQNYSVM